MMQAEEDVDGAEQVVGAHQLELLVLRQIAEMHGTKLSERHVHGDGLRVFQVALGGFKARAIGIGLARTGEGLGNHLARRGNDADIDAIHRDGVARFRDEVLAFFGKRQ